MKKTIKHYQELTEEEARVWLMANDKEDSDFWRHYEEGKLVEAVGDNLRDFGDADGLAYLKPATDVLEAEKFNCEIHSHACFGLVRDGGDFAILGTLNNSDEQLTRAEFGALVMATLETYLKAGINELKILHRQDAPAYVDIDGDFPWI